MRRFKINDTMHGQTIWLIVDCTQEKMLDVVHKQFKIADKQEPCRGANGRSICLEDKDAGLLVHIIWLEHYAHSVSEFGLLVHELLHLTFGVLDDLGFELHDSSEEAYTYYMQHLTMQCLKKLCRKKLRKK